MATFELGDKARVFAGIEFIQDGGRLYIWIVVGLGHIRVKQRLRFLEYVPRPL